MKFKNIFFMLAVSTVIFSCSKDNTNIVPFDAAKQALEDDVTLIEYLQTHYLNDADGGIWTIKNGETPLMGQVETQEVTYKDIAYKLYVLKQNEGSTVAPSSVDSIVINYTGMFLDSTVFDSSTSSNWNLIFNISNDKGYIEGWKRGLKNFKGGTVKINDDESFDYENYGKGILFIPSGLAYGNQGSQSGVIKENLPLVFEISLKSVHLTDHDLDGVKSKFEDINGDNDLFNDDSDGDGIVNFLDVDDDNDGILTKDEDANGNGNWFDDDTDGDGKPNFLDKDN